MVKIRTIPTLILVLLALGCPSRRFCALAENSHEITKDSETDVADESAEDQPGDEKIDAEEEPIAGVQLESEEPVPQELTKDKGPSKPKPKMGDYKSGFRRLCQAMKDDGRLEPFYDLLYWSKGFDPECLACKPFFETFSSACTPPTKVKEVSGRSPESAEGVSETKLVETKSPSETPEPGTHKQREPNARVISNTSQVFALMAENQKDLPENIKAVRRLLYLMTDPEDPTKGELEYYSILSEYILAPFRAYEERLQREAARGDLGGVGGKSKSADPSTFDF